MDRATRKTSRAVTHGDIRPPSWRRTRHPKHALSAAPARVSESGAATPLPIRSQFERVSRTEGSIRRPHGLNLVAEESFYSYPSQRRTCIEDVTQGFV